MYLFIISIAGFRNTRMVNQGKEFYHNFELAFLSLVQYGKFHQPSRIRLEFKLNILLLSITYVYLILFHRTLHLWKLMTCENNLLTILEKCIDMIVYITFFFCCQNVFIFIEVSNRTIM